MDYARIVHKPVAFREVDLDPRRNICGFCRPKTRMLLTVSVEDNVAFVGVMAEVK